jgi:hypothetical protein
MKVEDLAPDFESFRFFIKAGHSANYGTTKRGFNFFPRPDAFHSSQTETASPFACVEGKSVV